MKKIVFALGLVMAFSLVGVASAATVTIEDIIAALKVNPNLFNQIQASLSSTATSNSSVAITRNLKLGASDTADDSSVSALQQVLIDLGHLNITAPTGKFLGMTQKAVIAWQKEQGLPATGYFGPMSREALAKSSTSNTTTGTTGTTPGMSTPGAEGNLDKITTLGDIETDLDVNSTGNKVIGIEFRAKDSDMSIGRVDATFTINGNGSTLLSKYISSATLMIDGNKVATKAAADGSKDGSVWTMRFDGLNTIVKKDAYAKMYIVVDTVTSIGSAEDGDSITVAIPNNGIRAVSGNGISDTYVSVSTTGYTQNITVSTATKGTLTISDATGNTSANQVKADSDNTTDDVVLGVFNLKAKNSAVTLDTLPVTLASVGAGVGEIIQTVKLVKDGTVIKTVSVSSGTATGYAASFEDLNQTIAKDSTATYKVLATVRKLSGNFDAGDTLTASASTTATNLWSAEDANGDTATLSGSTIGGTVLFQTISITVAKGSVTSSADAAGTATFSIPVTVTAGDDAVYLSDVSPAQITAAATPGTAAISYSTSTNEGAVSSDVLDSSDGYKSNDSSGSYYKIDSGTSRNFTLRVVMTNTSTSTLASNRVVLRSLAWGTTTTINQAFTSDLGTFVTPSLSWKTSPY